jgi:phosphoribosylformylglycinamidine cyclo-ligase
MSGLYTYGKYDLAGFVVGAVERDDLLPKPTCQVSDRLLGLKSSGLHANGFSLMRHIVEQSGLSWDGPAPFAPHQSLAQACLEPSRIYTGIIHALLKENKGIKAIAHITGGGLTENIPRVLPQALTYHLIGLNTMPPVFEWLAHEGRLSFETMVSTFNCGIGMVLVVDPEAAPSLHEHAARLGDFLIDLGHLRQRP